MKKLYKEGHNYGFFWNGLCFNYLISTLCLGFKAGLFEGNLFWVGQYDLRKPSYWKKK